METTTHKMRRRSFFAFLLAGGTGTFTFGGLLRKFTRLSTVRNNSKSITVKINPQAVPRTKTDTPPHG
jgi:hypothetical protein